MMRRRTPGRGMHASSAGERTIRLAVADARRDASSSCCSDASCACEVVRGERQTRGDTNPCKKCDSSQMVTATSHTAIMLIRTMKLLFSFEQVKHCDFDVFYLISQRFYSSLDLFFSYFRISFFLFQLRNFTLVLSPLPTRTTSTTASLLVREPHTCIVARVSNLCTFSNGLRALRYTFMKSLFPNCCALIALHRPQPQQRRGEPRLPVRKHLGS
jgi:hypothetical protein